MGREERGGGGGREFGKGVRRERRGEGDRRTEGGRGEGVGERERKGGGRLV